MLIEAIPTVGKNTQQIRAAILKQFKAYEKLLKTFCGSARVEASLIVHVQVRGLPLCLHGLVPLNVLVCAIVGRLPTQH